MIATNQLVAVNQQVVEVVGVAGDAEGGAERGCEVPDGLAASAGVAHKAPGWLLAPSHQVNSKWICRKALQARAPTNARAPGTLL